MLIPVLLFIVGLLFLIKGGDWDITRIVGRDVVEAAGGTVLSLPLIPGYSTTALAERIRKGGA